MRTFSLHGALARGAVTVDPPSNNLLDIFVIDAGIGKGGFAGFFDHVRIVPVASSGLFKLGHSDPDDKYSPKRRTHVN